MLRDAAYESLTLARRRLHRRVAEAIRELSGARDDLARLALIAAHEREAGREPEAALAFAVAGMRASNVWATQEAIGHLETAIALRHPEPWNLHAQLGELRMRAGDYVGSIASLETAAASAPADLLPATERALATVHRDAETGHGRRHLIAALAAVAGSGLAPRQPPANGRASLQREAAPPSGVATPLRRRTSPPDRWRLRPPSTMQGRPCSPTGWPHSRRAPAAISRRPTAIWPRVWPSRSGPETCPPPLRRAMPAPWSRSNLGAYGTAVRLAQEALDDARRIGDRHLEAVVENTLADACHAAGDEDAAREHGKRAATLFADVGGGASRLEPGIWQLDAW